MISASLMVVSAMMILGVLYTIVHLHGKLRRKQSIEIVRSIELGSKARLLLNERRHQIEMDGIRMRSSWL